MKALLFSVVAAAVLLSSEANARPCVNIQANVQNKSNNTRTINQNCNVNISGNIQAGTNNNFQAQQTGDKNVSRSHQIGSESNTSSTVQSGRINRQHTNQRGR